MSKHPIHFFTDQDFLEKQDASDAFGPSTKDPLTQFRLTSSHKATGGNAKAYAVTAGQIFVQEDSNGLLNIILKPKNQAVATGFAVRYFIYRGIAKESLIDGDYVAANPGTSDDIDLIADIWAKQNILNDLTGSTTSPTVNVLGAQYNDTGTGDFATTGNELLESFFYKKNEDFQLWDVTQGWSIGLFDSGHIGFEIVTGNIQPSIGLARLAENWVYAGDYTSTPSAGEQFANKNMREAVLYYIDPCAFYGLFYRSGIKTKIARLSGVGIYDKLLASVFANYNKLYIDIRNQHGNSYSYYFPDFNEVAVKFNGSTVYSGGYQTYFWPLLILDTPVSGVTKERAEILVTFTGEEEPAIVLHLAQGFYSQDYPKIRKKITTLYKDATGIIQLKLKAPATGTDLVPGYTRFSYIKKITNPLRVFGDFELGTHTYVDNLYDLSQIVNAGGDLQFPFEHDKNDCCWHMLEEYAYTDEDSGYVGGYMAKVGYAKDKDNFYFFGFANGEELRRASVDPHLLTGSKADADFMNGILLPFFDPVTIVNQQLNLATPEDASEDDLKRDITAPTRKSRPSNDNVFIITISNGKLDEFKTALATYDNSFPRRLVIREAVAGSDIDGKSYTKGALYITGYDSTGVLQKQQVDTTIKFYKYGI